MALESTWWASIGSGAPSIRHSIWRVIATDTADVVDGDLRGDLVGGRQQVVGRVDRAHEAAGRAPRAASNTRPVKVHSSAVLMPTTRGRNHDEQASGTRPRRANTNPNLAVSRRQPDVHRQRHGGADAHGRPVDGADHRLGALEDAQGEEAALVAVGRRGRRRRPWRGCRRRRRRCRRRTRGRPRRRSPGPGPVTTTTRTSGSASASVEGRAQLSLHRAR